MLALAHFQARRCKWSDWYDRLLIGALPFTILTFIAVAAVERIQIIPTLIVDKAANVEDRLHIPYTPLDWLAATLTSRRPLPLPFTNDLHACARCVALR